MIDLTVPWRLPVRRTPAKQESFKGFLLSLAHLNGLADLRWVAKNATLPARFATSPCDLTGLAVLGGCPPTSLESLPNWPIHGRHGLVRFGDSVIHGLDFDLSHPKICAACVGEERPIPRVWDLTALAACPAHSRFLIDGCPHCGKRLTWLRPGPAECKCGADLHSVEIGAEPPRSVLVFASWISALALGQTPRSDTGVLGAAVGQLDDLLRLIRFFAVDDGGQPSARPGCVSKPSVSQAIAGNIRAASVLVGWPDGFYEWLARRRVGQTGMDADLGPSLRRLRSAFGGPSFGFVTAAVSQYLASEWDGGVVRTWSRYYAPPPAARRVVGVTAASKVLATNVGTVGALLERGELKGRRGEKRAAKLVDAVSLQQLHAGRQAAISSTQLAHALKVHRKEIGRLRRHGFLKSSHRSRSGHMFLPGAGHDLISSLQRQASPTEEPSDGISLAEIPYWRQVSLTSVLRMIEEQEVKLYVHLAQASYGLCHFKVSKAEVLWASCTRPSGPMLTVREAAEELGLAVRMIPVLVQAGCLEGELNAVGRLKKRGVRLASVRRFRKDYVLCSEAAKAEETNTASIARRLGSTNAKPVVVSDIRRGISAVWRRDEVAHVLVPL